MLHRIGWLTAVALLTALSAAAGVTGSQAASDVDSRVDQARAQATVLISRANGASADGAVPNGPSTNAVISNDKRYARVIAFESEASNLVSGDTNGVKDIFMVRRARPINNIGTPWRPGDTLLVSRTSTGQAANGPSFSPAVDGAFHRKPSCVAFLSAASNIVPGDTNGKVDAFVSRGPGGPPIRVSLPGGRQASSDTTAVAVSGGCSQIAFVTAGTLYVRRGPSAREVRALAQNATDPSFSRGLRNDLVFAAPRGVFLSKGGTARPRLVGPGGRNPAYNDVKRQVVIYEKTVGGHVQVVYHDLGKREVVASAHGGSPGNGDSRNPSIGNSGYYMTFETDASNLGVNATGRVGDFNSKPDVYLYTNVRDMTLVQSVEEKAVPLPGGGVNPSMSFYANYIVFDAPAPLGNADGPHQVYMRYLGPV
jgi:hypothetical protein